MNVLLINPPIFNIIRESLPPVVEDSTGFYPPLGLLYLAAYAESLPDVNIKVLDTQALELDYPAIEREIAEFAPDVVGIQVMTFTLIDAYKVAQSARKTAPEAFILLGGPHTTLYPAETVQLPEVDAVVVGEGEYPFDAILKALQAGTSVDGIPSVVTKNTPQADVDSLELKYVENLDDLKSPSRHLLDLSLYSSPMAVHRSVTTMMSSRGCPGRCIFCDRPQMGKRFRKRSARAVVEEMAYCVENGIGEIVFYDDTFTIDKQRVFDICDMIIDRKLDVRWDIRARIDTMVPEMIPKLRKAGCDRIHYGVETGNPRMQKLIRKNLDLEKVREIFTATKKGGVETLGYFMIGLPTETRAEIDETLGFMMSLPMDYAHIALFTPYPGTEVYRNALADGFYSEDYWTEFAKKPHQNFTPKYWNEHFSDEELLGILKNAYGKFYSRPGYILQRLLKVRSVGELMRKSKLGLQLLKETAFSR